MTGAVVASHTIGGRVAREEMAILEKAGLDLIVSSGSIRKWSQTLPY